MNNPFIIAEIAQAHNGSLQKVYDYIDALAGIGIDAIKFQTHIAAAESSIHEPFRIKFSDQDATRFDYWKRMEFTKVQWKEIKIRCEKAGLEFMSSPFSNAAVDLLEEIGVARYKVGSGEVNNFLLLEKMAKTGKPIIVSSGMSSFAELDQTVSFLKKKKVDYSILQCTTSYPTLPTQYGLNVISELKERYQVPIGFSDHSADSATCIAAAALGAEILEFHVVFSHSDFGPDASSSIEISEIPKMVHSIRAIAKASHHPIDKNDNSQFKDLKQVFEKSLAVNKDLQKGHILTFKDLEAKKPKSYGIDAAQFQSVLGKELTKELSQWDFLTQDAL
ncbi:N-acetylneuraminate synthase family protein [Patiriisocius sp. Uisw_017]|uniref:N-acetylneuraminate synthase family protein n=1 Tax=Patiriisocius sp. Uisw_017 TaxID=3230968 RepID=UPI0039E9C985